MAYKDHLAPIEQWVDIVEGGVTWLRDPLEGAVVTELPSYIERDYKVGFDFWRNCGPQIETTLDFGLPARLQSAEVANQVAYHASHADIHLTLADSAPWLRGVEAPSLQRSRSAQYIRLMREQAQSLGRQAVRLESDDQVKDARAKYLIMLAASAVICKLETWCIVGDMGERILQQYRERPDWYEVTRMKVHASLPPWHIGIADVLLHEYSVPHIVQHQWHPQEWPQPIRNGAWARILNTGMVRPQDWQAFGVRP